MSDRIAIGAAAVSTLVALCASGCGIGGPEVARLGVSQAGWDTLVIDLRFTDRDLIGRSEAVVPLSVRYAVFDGRYDTLYVGTDTVVFVDDRRLGDSEPILVEACGRFAADTVCEQQTVFASPKRVRSQLEVEYPSDDEYMRGTYRVAPVVERRVFGSDGWERLPGALIPLLVADVRVDGSGTPGIRIPLRSTRGPFDLRGGEGYRDFRFHLRSAFRDSGRAQIVFQVLAGEAGSESPAGSVRLALVDKSEEEQLAELEALIGAAGRRLLARLRGYFGGGRTYVFVNSWTYDSGERRYEAEIEFYLAERSGSGWSGLVARLQAAEDGSHALIRLLEADDELRQRWLDRVGADSLDLGAIEDPATRPERRTRAW